MSLLSLFLPQIEAKPGALTTAGWRASAASEVSRLPSLQQATLLWHTPQSQERAGLADETEAGSRDTEGREETGPDLRPCEPAGAWPARRAPRSKKGPLRQQGAQVSPGTSNSAKSG